MKTKLHLAYSNNYFFGRFIVFKLILNLYIYTAVRDIDPRWKFTLLESQFLLRSCYCIGNPLKNHIPENFDRVHQSSDEKAINRSQLSLLTINMLVGILANDPHFLVSLPDTICKLGCLTITRFTELL